MPRRRTSPAAEPHATEAQVRQRVEELLRIRLDGAEVWDVREYVREKIEENDPVWLSRGVQRLLSESQLYRYLERADALIAESAEPDRKKLIGRHLAQRRALYAKAVNVGDLRAALAVLADEAKLLNLYPPKRTELSGPDGGPIPTAAVEMTDDERAAAIAALHARLGAADARQNLAEQPNAARHALGEAGTADGTGRDDAGPLADGVAPLFG